MLKNVMNVLFHITAATGIIAAITDTRYINTTKDVVLYSLSACFCGIMSHGFLDYIPHTYPIPSKFDTIAGLVIIIVGVLFAKKRYKWIVLSALLGSILPDLLDLLPSIINKYSGIDLHLSNQKLFPWHLPMYSGSIFNSSSIASNINHIAVVLLAIIVCWFRRYDLKTIFGQKPK